MRWSVLIVFFCITCCIHNRQVLFCCRLSAAEPVIERYLEVLHKDPKHGAVFDRVYRYYSDIGEADVFLNQCKIRTEQEPDKTAAQILYGLAAQRQGSLKIAAEAFRKAAQMETENYLPPFYLGEVLIADRQFRSGITALEEAVNRLKKTQASGKQLRDVLQTLGSTLLRFGEQKKAQAVWLELESLFPDDTEIVTQIAETLEAGGQLDEAVKRYQTLIDKTQDSYERVRLTLSVADLTLQKNSNPDEAAGILNELLNLLDAESYLLETVYERIERIYHRSKNTGELKANEALAAFYRSRLEINPNDTASVRHLAALLNNDEAEKLLKTAVEKLPKNVTLRSAFIDVLTAKKDFDEAVKQCQAIDEIDNGNVDNLTRWGLLYLQNTALDETRRKQEAVKIWQRISNDIPDDPVSATVVADLCFRNNMTNEAEEFYRKAFELKPENFSYREHLAKFYYAAKRKADVLAVLLPEENSETDDTGNMIQTGALLLHFGYAAECCRRLAGKSFENKIENNRELQRLFIEALLKRGKTEDIERAFKLFSQAEELIEDDQEFAEFLKQELALLRPLQRTGKFFKTVEQDAGQTQSPDSYRKYWKLAVYRHSEVKLSAASLAVEEALKRAVPKPPEALQKFAAELYEQKGDTEKAVALYRQLAAQQTPQRNGYLKHIASLQMQSGELEQALETSRTLFGSGGAANVRYYAELLLSINRQNEAVGVLRQGLRNEPGNTELLQVLAQTLYNMNRKDEAFEIAYRQFESTKDFSGKLALLDTLCNTFQNESNNNGQKDVQTSGKIDALSNNLRLLKQNRETQFYLARVSANTGDNDSARQILEKILDFPDGNRSGSAVTDIIVLKELVKVTENQDDINAALRYQELLCSNNKNAGGEEHLFQLYEKAGETEKADKLFLELVLRQSGLPEKLEAIDTMIRRKEYEMVLKVLDFFEIHEPENWQLPLRRIVIQALKNEPLEASIDEFRRMEFADTVQKSAASASGFTPPESFEFAATAPAAFLEPLAAEQNLYENILRKEKPETILDKVQSFDEARFAVLGLLLNEKIKKDFGGGNTPPAIWHHFRNTAESVRDSLPIDSKRTDILLERLQWEAMLLYLRDSEPIRKNAATFRQQINADTAQQNVRRIVRKLGLADVPQWDAPLFQILIMDSINECIADMFRKETDDKILENKLLQILNEYCGEKHLPQMMPDEYMQFVKLAEYIIKNARTQKTAAEQDELLTQKKRLDILTAVWTKYGRSNTQRDRAVFENGTAQYYSHLIWLLRQYQREDKTVTEILDSAAGRNPLWYVLKADMFSYPLDINPLLFVQLANCEALEEQLERLKPHILKACGYCNENNRSGSRQVPEMRDAIFQVLDSLLYPPRLRRYDIFAPHERELVGKMPEEIRRQLQMTGTSAEGLFARQLFGWEPYPSGSQRIFKSGQIKRVAELDYGLNQLLDFAVTIIAGLPVQQTLSQPPLAVLMKPLAFYQAELTGAKPVSRSLITPLTNHIAFADDYSPADDFFFRIALLYRALDTKTRYIVTQSDGGTS
ncbi:MAG: hypothetical protein LBT46_10760, partial [Planctomycetaceae bacterium]|nr:hypothetical protein [Planctomycetaceae bacterium]